MKTIMLSKRLSTAADFIIKGARVADIGTDHGYLPVWLILNSVAKSVIASDINEAPQQRAKASAAKYGVNEIEFRLSDGLKGFEPGEVDTIVIAGMGGENIAEILDCAPWAHSCNLILQPMTKRERLVLWLRENGMRINSERLARENNIIYPIFQVTQGSDGDVSEAGLYISKALIEKKDELLSDYIDWQIWKLKRARVGLEKSKQSDVWPKIKKLILALEGLEKMRGEL